MAAPEVSRGTRVPLLVATALSAGPPGAPAPVLRPVSLVIARGDWLAVTGPNGAGKTTLALALAGLWPARSGVLEFAGEPQGPQGRPRVVTLLQEPASQITQRTVRDEIGFTAINLGAATPDAWRSAAQWAARFDLEDALERPPQELSAGRQQCVLLAGALAADPDVLIADEAAAHLDRETRQKVLALLRERVDAGLTLVWVTQEPAELRWATRVIEVGMGGECTEREPAPPVVFHADSAARGAGAAESGIPTGVEVGAAPADREAPPQGPAAIRLRVGIRPAPGARVTCGAPLSFEVGSRGVWALSGPNGSGKSSLLEVLAGIETLPEVTVEWEASSRTMPILAGQYPERQIFEERVGDEMVFAAVCRGVSRAVAVAEAHQLLVSFEFGPALFERRTWSLSVGEKRLVSVLGTLLAPAPLILLDEPTCGIDPERRHRLALTVREYSARSPVIVASQDWAWIREVGAIEVALGEKDEGRRGVPA